ncbi:hypothetical protein MRX96_008173 [Rhipicephalus microplus]
MNIAGDCVGVMVVQSVMYHDLSPGAHTVPARAQTVADECDGSSEPYYRRDPYVTPPQDDLPTSELEPIS